MLKAVEKEWASAVHQKSKLPGLLGSELTDTIAEGITPPSTSIDMERVLAIGLTLISFYLLSYLLSAIQGWII